MSKKNEVMIVVEGEKYACERCIRGHRSSTCRHIGRPLVLVRGRGRPLTDSRQRIAIEAESRGCSCSSQGGKRCRCQTGDVIVLKANKRQVYNVSSGSLRLLDPVAEVATVEKGLEVMARSNSQTPQFLPSGDSVKEGGCATKKGCCGSKSEASAKAGCSNNMFIPYEIEPKKEVKVEPVGGIELPTEMDLLGHPPDSCVSENPLSGLFSMYYADSCVVPGTCLCEPDDCQCDGCAEHGNAGTVTGASVQDLFKDFPFDLDLQSMGHIELTQAPSVCVCEDGQCCCYNCDVHGIVNGVSMGTGGTAIDDHSATCATNTIKVTATEFPFLLEDTTPTSPANLQEPSSCCKAKQSSGVEQDAFLEFLNTSP